MILAAYYHPILATLFGFAAIVLIGVILLQRGKGVGLAGAFGGAGGHTAFGAKTGDFLTWATVAGAAIMLTFAIILNYVFVPLTPPTPPGMSAPPGGAGIPTAPAEQVPSGGPPEPTVPPLEPVPTGSPSPGQPIREERCPRPAARILHTLRKYPPPPSPSKSWHPRWRESPRLPPRLRS